jgi:proteasome accessory factor C
VNTSLAIRKLVEALDSKTQVILKGYQSANSNTIQDRLVEPLSFINNYSMLSVFELSSGEIKTFKIERIHNVELIHTPRTYTGNVSMVSKLDPFGMSEENQLM